MKKYKILILLCLIAAGGVVLAVRSGMAGNTVGGVNDRYLTNAIRADYPGFVGQEAELASSSARLAKEYAASDERDRRESQEKWGEDRAADELKNEQEWQRIGTTPCSSFGRGSEPQLCIEHLGPEAVAIGTPVNYRVRWRNVPAGAYIRVWSRNAAPAGQRWKYMGAYGAIAPGALGGSRDGDQRVTWDGRSVYCAPTDAPMMCDAGEVGRYVLRAAIMTGSDPFWPSWPIQNPVPVARLAQSETQPFTLDGSPQPVSIQGRYREYRLRREVVETIRKALPPGGAADWYVERRIERLGPWQAGLLHYCSRLSLDKPLAGSIDVCFSRFRRDANGIALSPGDITASGDARFASGILNAKEAVTKATSYAIGMTAKQATYPAYPGETDMVRKLYPDPKKYDGGYQALRNAARDAGLTYVEVNQPWASFRHEPNGSWWLVQLGLWIQTIDGPRMRDWGKVSLRVDHNGKVCRIEPTGKREGEGRDRIEVYSGCLPDTQRQI